ncbi:MAG: hypothetical protein K5945_10530 [Bacteroidaceae bacterium]|nr:hypothetical protein [Bacteroidaceae bacterium]
MQLLDIAPLPHNHVADSSSMQSPWIIAALGVALLLCLTAAVWYRRHRAGCKKES